MQQITITEIPQYSSIGSFPPPVLGGVCDGCYASNRSSGSVCRVLARGWELELVRVVLRRKAVGNVLARTCWHRRCFGFACFLFYVFFLMHQRIKKRVQKSRKKLQHALVPLGFAAILLHDLRIDNYLSTEHRTLNRSAFFGTPNSAACGPIPLVSRKHHVQPNVPISESTCPCNCPTSAAITSREHPRTAVRKYPTAVTKAIISGCEYLSNTDRFQLKKTPCY